MRPRWALVGLLVSLAGCPHQPPPGDGGTHDAPLALDAGPPQPETVSIAVVDQYGVVDGAMLFVDDANGMRHTATAGSDGRVTIPDVAWTPGAISITSVAPHHPIETLAGFRRSDLGNRADASGTITVRMARSYATFAASGSVLHADPADTVTLSLDVRGSLGVVDSFFVGTVEQNVPFHVFALAGGYTMQTPMTETFVIHALVDLPHDALTADATFDVDLASPVALDTVSGTILPPMDGTALDHIYPRLTVSTDESYLTAVLGRATSIQVGSASLAYTAQFAHVIAGTPVTVLYISSSSAYAQIAVDGVPGALPVSSSGAWPSPPLLASPAAGGVASLHDPITFRSVDRSAPVIVTVAAGGSDRWYVELPSNATSTTIPAEPDGTDTTAWTNIAVRVESCDAWPGHRTRCSRRAGGDAFTATLP